MKPIATTTVPLSADQLRVAQHFAALDDEAQQATLAMMAAMAEARPRRSKPALRLVGGAK